MDAPATKVEVVPEKVTIEDEKVVPEKEKNGDEKGAQEKEKIEGEKVAPEEEKIADEKIAPEKEKIEDEKVAPEKEKIEDEKVAPEKVKIEDEKVAPETEKIVDEKVATEKTEHEKVAPEMVKIEDEKVVPEKEKIEDEREAGPVFHCDLCDTEIVHKIAQGFLPGLSAACVDNTSGDIFRSPGSVAAEIRKEMVDYLIQRSETFVAESVILEGTAAAPETDVSDHPFDIISDIVDDFAMSKRNLLSRVSGWLLSEKREDKIDDFIQEMEMNGFWLMGKREEIAQTMLKNVDFKNLFHCDQKFNTAEELEQHLPNCGFRTLNCTNEGCTTQFSANHLEKHDSVCPFKIIPCEQKCSDYIMRREMDRHCITRCPMKLVNCPFYSVGCESTVPQCTVQQHLSDNLQTHLMYALKNIHKGISADDLKKRAEQIAESSVPDQLAKAKDVRSLTIKVKNLEVELGPIETSTDEKVDEESTEALKKVSEDAPKSPEKVNEESAKSPESVNQEPSQAPKVFAEESTESCPTQKNVSKESTEAPKNFGEQSVEAVKNVGEESTQAQKNDSEEFTDAQESSPKALKNTSEEPIRTQKNFGEESSEAPKNAGEDRDESAESLKIVVEQSTETLRNARQESTS
ncbi:hypothetical protein Tsubulata_017760 [Turnera subulata]|uniref:TRAF-type domain-containing protein n=1 Tax=Turnera subulata TaxID=218843 RepID=A0A9Q0J8Y9_9ROSI|nr:hypothetical protein Tsubulata_017760 [Turnera subulata]